MSPEFNNSFSDFINRETWMTLPGGGWIEMGLKNGYTVNGQAGTWDGSCNCNAYSVFWADTQPGGSNFWRHIVTNTTPTGATDTYQISRAGTVNHWNVYWRGNLVGVSTGTQRWSGEAQQVGGEYSGSTSARGFADSTDMFTKHINGSGQPVNWGWPSWYRIDGAAGFEGVSFIPSSFSWQKHH